MSMSIQGLLIYGSWESASGVFDCDLHTHSRFFHLPSDVGAAYDPYGVRMSLRFARRRGLDGLAVTNHDFLDQTTIIDSRCIPGIEISTTKGHLLVVGPDPPQSTTPGELDPTSAVELAHEHGCAAIIAHPFRNSTLREIEAPFDAIEINGKHPEHRRKIESIASERGIPVVGGSDAHFPFEVGRVSTRIDVDNLTPTAVVAAIRDGHVKPVYHENAITRSLRSAYTRIHRMKGHIDTAGRASE